MTLYHHTDTARLPWILSSGYLMPGRNRIGGMPDDVLWATTAAVGDRTASLDRGVEWRNGNLFHVRVRLDPDGFEPWAQARESVGFTPSQIAKLEGAPGADPASWWFRRQPLPVYGDTVIEVKSYRDPRWRRETIEGPFQAGPPNGLGIRVAGRFFGSVQETGVAGGRAYRLLVVG